MRKLRSALFDNSGVAGELNVRVADQTIEYVNFYISPENIRLADIDEN